MRTGKRLPKLIREGLGAWACLMLLLGTINMVFAETHLDTLRRNFSNYRLGMFLHYGMNTFNGSGKDNGNQPVAQYNPTKLNPAQWVSCAKQAHMKYMVLVAKHADGFCNWDTKTTDYKCTNPGVNAAARKDVVALYVKACRDSGIVPGIYYSVTDYTWNKGALGFVSNDPLGRSNITKGRLPRESLDYTFKQIQELLHDYGDIPFFVDDGWAWSIGHTAIPYQEFRDTLVKNGPNTIFCEHEGLFYPWHEDVIYYENSKKVFPPDNNTYASWISNTVVGSGWFWNGSTSEKSVSSILTSWVDRCDPVWCNVAPNIPPNNEGLLSQQAATWCKDFGTQVDSHLKANRAPLPTQGPHMEYVITAIGASSTGGTARLAIDGISDGGFADHYTQSVWTSSSGLPQSITVDLGATYDSVNMCENLPVQIARQDATTADSMGSITGYTLAASTDGNTFTNVTLTSGSNGTWAKNTTMKYAQFNPVNKVRYFKLTATATIGGTKAEISELDFGYSDWNKNRATGVKKLSPCPNIAAIYTPEKTGLLTSLTNKSLGNWRSLQQSGGSMTYYGIDGRKCFNLPSVSAQRPLSAASGVYVVKRN